MKRKDSKFLVAILFALVAIVVDVVATIIVGNRVGFDKIAAASTFDNYVTYLNFSRPLDVFTLLPFIATVAAGVFLVFDFVFSLVKKAYRYLAPTFVGAVALFDCALMATFLDPSALNIVEAILVFAGMGLSFLALLLTFIFLLGQKKDRPVVKEEPFVAPALKEEEPVEEEAEEAPVEEEEEVEEEPAAEVEEKKEEPIKEAKPAPSKKKAEIAPVEKSEKKEKVLGKYETFPEAGFYKYRLMANNGEILIVSNGYRTRDGARNGIVTLKKNIEGGISKVITDKNGYSQFRIFTSNDSRLVASGEFYASVASAQKALNSVERFYRTERIVDLEDIPEEENREWKVDLPPINPNKNGKFEVFIEEESSKWQARLIANNGAILFITATYSSKNTLLNALANIKNKVLDGNIDIARDKMNRYHFHVISENGSVLLMGETYPSRDSAISAAVSVRNFISDAKVVDLSK